MKAIGGTLKTLLLNGTQFGGVVECYTFTLKSGNVLRFNSGDTDITLGGNVFQGQQVRMERSKIKQAVGIQPDELAVEMYPSPSDALITINGIAYTLLQAMLFGFFDAADVKVERVVMLTWGDTSLGSVILFQGRVSDSEMGRSSVMLTLRDYRELLNTQAPRNLIQPSCRHTLYGSGCTLNKASFAVAGVVLSGSTVNTILFTNAQATGYFDLGSITFGSGQNLNAQRTIKSGVAGTPHTLNLQFPLQYVPQAGDTFTAYPGCDHLQVTCNTKYANLIHFGGMPFVPTPETAI